ncbi:MAG TPA: helix-turn-helix transcriptional regulator [Firmicutes bacterium]|nr:helix-turn-helix transcriptional regulator [Bacillota bacterium]
MAEPEAAAPPRGAVQPGTDLDRELHALTGVAELFKVLSDDTRSKLIYALGQRELCVGEMAELLNISLPAVSHHLRVLRQLRLVTARRAGKEVFYSLREEHIITLIAAALVSARALGLVASLEPALV